MAPPVSTLPRIAPVIPVARTHAFDDPDWLFEPKFDGFRAILCIDGASAEYSSKRGRPLKRFARLASAIRAKLGARSVILDGEVVSLDEQGRVNFIHLMSGLGELHYAAFDLLWLDGTDLRPLPLRERRDRLASLIGDTSPLLSHIFGSAECGRDLFQVVKLMDLEGIVAKRLDDPYAPETVWYKIKNRGYTQMAPHRFDQVQRPR
jgi:bifunctional non-homologous end joining protein LigD